MGLWYDTTIVSSTERIQHLIGQHSEICVASHVSNPLDCMQAVCEQKRSQAVTHLKDTAALAIGLHGLLG